MNIGKWEIGIDLKSWALPLAFDFDGVWINMDVLCFFVCYYRD